MGHCRPAADQLSARPEALAVEDHDLRSIAQPAGANVISLFLSKKNLFGRAPVGRQLRHEHARRARDGTITHSKKSIPTRTTRFPQWNERSESRFSEADRPILPFAPRAAPNRGAGRPARGGRGAPGEEAPAPRESCSRRRRRTGPSG